MLSNKNDNNSNEDNGKNFLYRRMRLWTIWQFQKFNQLKYEFSRNIDVYERITTNFNTVLNFINILHKKLLGTLKIPENQLELEQLELQNKRRRNYKLY